MKLVIYKISILISILISVGCNKISPEEQLKNAEIEYKKNNFQTVIIQMKNLIRDKPENKDARLLSANSNYQVGLFLNAEKEYNKATELGISNDLISNFYVKTLYGNEDFNGIIAFWNKNNSQLTLAQKAEIAPVVSLAYLNQGKYQESFDVAISGKSWAVESNIEKLLTVNSAYVNTFNKPQNTERTIIELTAACDKYPSEWIICSLLANTLSSENKFSEAATVLETILKNKPNYNKLVFQLAENHVKAENYTLAKPYIAVLLNSFPYQPYVNLLAATIEMKNENFEQALIYINTTLNQNYESPQAKLIAGVIHYQLGNYEQANNQLNGLNNSYPNNPVVQKLYIATQLKLGNSTSLYSAASQITPSKENSDFLANVSLELLNLGEKDKSAKILSTIDTSLIENQKILRNVSLIKLKSGDISGIDDLERALNKLIQSKATLEEINKHKVLLISSLIAIKDIESAEKYISSWIETSSNNIENYQLLAEIEKRKKTVDTNKISQIYTSILTMDKNNTKANIYFGNNALNKKEYMLAREYYLTALNSNNINFQAVQGVYISSIQLNKSTQATQEIETILNGYKDDIRERLVLSQFYLMSKQPSKTITLLKDLTVETNTYDNEINFILAEAFLQKEQYDEAIELYKGILNNNLSNNEIIKKLTYAFEKSDNLDGAIKTFEELKNKSPDDLQIGLTLASFYIYTDKKNKTLTFINSLTEQQQQHPMVAGLKGKALYYIGDYQQALSSLSSSYKKMPDSKTMMLIFNSNIKLNKNDDALTGMAKHLEKYPNDIMNRAYYANELVKKNKPKAILQYQQIVNVDNKNIIALNNLAWLMYEERNLLEAKKYIDVAIQYAPENPEVVDTFNKINEALKIKSQK